MLYAAYEVFNVDMNHCLHAQSVAFMPPRCKRTLLLLLVIVLLSEFDIQSLTRRARRVFGRIVGGKNLAGALRANFGLMRLDRQLKNCQRSS